MPVFNGYDHVVEALEVALRETSTQVPFCVINDASSDARIAQWIEQLGSSGRLEHDLYYIDNWSMTLDFRILWLTVFSSKAYRNAR